MNKYGFTFEYGNTTYCIDVESDTFEDAKKKAFEKYCKTGDKTGKYTFVRISKNNKHIIGSYERLENIKPWNIT